MTNNSPDSRNPPDSAGETAYRPYRIDWHNVDERRRERTRREAAGASRDLTATLVAGGSV
ncbi:hypothetical protein [Haloarcula sebkhae]|uniref:Uncharacterized protein n=1 Tax=Haloarcula sebkhae TaxID=932660 RepID=A0ACC6VR23_9EURY|nr:hypothetical protein [Haloarcula sebkhae]